MSRRFDHGVLPCGDAESEEILLPCNDPGNPLFGGWLGYEWQDQLDGALLQGTDRVAVLVAIEALGPVRHIVAPNKFHYLFVQDWIDKGYYPDDKHLHGVSERFYGTNPTVQRDEAIRSTSIDGTKI